MLACPSGRLLSLCRCCSKKRRRPQAIGVAMPVHGGNSRVHFVSTSRRWRNSWRGPATLGANGRAHLTHCQASSSSSAASGIRTASLDRVGRAPTPHGRPLPASTQLRRCRCSGVDVRRRDRPSCRVEDLDRSTLIRKDRGRSRLPRVNVEGLTARGGSARLRWEAS